MSSRSLIFFIAVVTVVSAARAEVPIHVQAGAGRNRAAIKLLKEAEDQLETGNLEQAKSRIDAALRSDPKLWPALYTRAKVFLLQDKCELAIRDCNEALRQSRTFIEAALLRASANACLGRYSEALKEIDHCITIRPRSDAYARALKNRAWLQATCPDPAFRNGEQAIKDAMNACKLLHWQDENAIDILAAAYAEVGDFDSAVQYAQQALAISGISPRDHKRTQRHLALFKQHKPVRWP